MKKVNNDCSKNKLIARLFRIKRKDTFFNKKKIWRCLKRRIKFVYSWHKSICRLQFSWFLSALFWLQTRDGGYIEAATLSSNWTVLCKLLICSSLCFCDMRTRPRSKNWHTCSALTTQHQRSPQSRRLTSFAFITFLFLSMSTHVKRSFNRFFFLREKKRMTSF